MVAHLRAGEVVARYGGEEFGVLIPGITREEALAWAEHDRRRVAELALPHPSSDAAPVVTVSIGVASAQPTEGSSPADLIAPPTAGSTRSRDGRNCVRADDVPGSLCLNTSRNQEFWSDAFVARRTPKYVLKT
jgi:diguanylate cyclase (GGDEF)-like protein